MTVALDQRDRAWLAGESTPADALAMRIVVAVAEAMGAASLLDIDAAHIDSCLFHGRAGLDFVERLVHGQGSVRVPTTLNVGSLDLLHPDLYRGDPETARLGRRQMEAYESLGCRPTWTCAPYQLVERPAFGRHVAWAESNAIVFANSMLGARTHRYGDFVDICAAIVGRVPAAGLHLDAARLGQVVYRLSDEVMRLVPHDVLYPVLGHLIGLDCGSAVPVIDGLPPSVSEDRVKALGAAAASSGSVAMVHIVGTTPEAPDVGAALGGREPLRTVSVDLAALRAARDDLSTVPDGESLDAVALGTPHASADEMEALVRYLDGRRPRIDLTVNTGRDILAAVPEAVRSLEAAGVRIVTDTCTYITPILDARVVMTDSAKWAWYAPANLGVDVMFGSTADCVESAVAGRVVRSSEVWT